MPYMDSVVLSSYSHAQSERELIHQPIKRLRFGVWMGHLWSFASARALAPQPCSLTTQRT